jgi:hypothetical protein
VRRRASQYKNLNTVNSGNFVRARRTLCGVFCADQIGTYFLRKQVGKALISCTFLN